MKELLASFIKDEEGQGLVEYALIAALIAVAAIVAMSSLSTKISTLFNTVGENLDAAG